MDQSFEKRAINQFLMELDGAEYDNTGVLAIGATNAPWDIDAALRRPGRFGKAIYVGEPDKKGRAAVLKIHMKKRPHSKRLSFGRLARMTEGFSAADLSAIADAAASIPWKEAIKSGKERVIKFSDFRDAMKGDDGVKPSLPPWYGSVKEKLIEAEDEDEDGNDNSMKGVFMDILTLSGDSESQMKQPQKAQTVKHKKEQEDLIPEEERELFHVLIKTIQTKADSTYNLLRRFRVLFAKYIM